MLKPAERRLLYLVLADMESGSHRQWLFLHLAANEERGEIRPQLVKVLGEIFQRSGAGTSGLLLRSLGMQGYSAYRLQMPRGWASALNLQLITASSLIFLHFIHAQPALMQETTITLVILGGISSAVTGWINASRQISSIKNATALNEARLPAPESVLGLTGVLIAAGISAEKATGCIERICADQASLEELQSLGLATPARPQQLVFCVVQAARAILLAALFVPVCAWLTGISQLTALALLPLFSIFVLNGLSDRAITVMGKTAAIIICVGIAGVLLHRR